MPQGILPYKYEEEKQARGMTSLAGLPLYLDLACALGLPGSIDRHLHLRPSHGWTDSQMVISLMLLALAGGDCVDDLKILQADEGFCRVIERVESEVSLSRWRRQKSRFVPSPSSVFRYLSAFGTQNKPAQGSVSIPRSPALAGLMKVNEDMVRAIQDKDPTPTATLDMDATLIETAKKDALFCYDGYKAYQPLNVYWAEQGILPIPSSGTATSLPTTTFSASSKKHLMDCLKAYRRFVFVPTRPGIPMIFWRTVRKGRTNGSGESSSP